MHSYCSQRLNFAQSSINEQLLQLMNELRTFNELCIINQGHLQSPNEQCTINESLVNNNGYRTIIIIFSLPSFHTSGSLILSKRQLTHIK